MDYQTFLRIQDGDYLLIYKDDGSLSHFIAVHLYAHISSYNTSRIPNGFTPEEWDELLAKRPSAYIFRRTDRFQLPDRITVGRRINAEIQEKSAAYHKEQEKRRPKKPKVRKRVWRHLSSEFFH